MRKRAVRVVTATGVLAFACVAPTLPTEPPSDAGVAFAVAPHAPCEMQEAGVNAVDCQAIDIEQNTIPLVGGGSALANVRMFTPTPTMLASATITGVSNYTFIDPSCTGQSCTFGPQALPYFLGVHCSSTTASIATLRVQGTNGMPDFDSANLTCDAMGPTIQVSPAMIPPLMTAVGMQVGSPQQITVTNNGTGVLNYSVSNTDSQFTLGGTSCMGYPNCSLSGGGGQHMFIVNFSPTAYGPVTDTFTFDGGAAGMPTVQVSGNGAGAVLDVDTIDHDFLQLARNAVGTRQVTITNQGNAPLNVTITGATAPFAASSTGFMNIMPSSSVMFDATCQSANEITPTTGMIMINSNAYMPAGGAHTIALHCEVLPTDLQIDPNPVDFGEVRKGASRDPIDVRLRNNSAAAETVTAVQLVGSNALSRTGFASGAIPGMTDRTVTVALDTDTELDLAGSRLEIALAGQPTPLAVPVIGKVVVPSAHVVPETLDLGTACLGSQVTGVVRMVNDGSATLMLEEPTMDQSFITSSMSMFPLSLAGGNEAAVDVRPTMMNVGPSSGTLTWNTSALGAPFKTFTIPVDLTYIPTGTAVSPRMLEFGAFDVSAISQPSTVTLRNCDPDPIAVRVEGVSATRGGVDAWEIEPRIVERTLASQETLTVSARFAPKRAGRHEARIMLRVGDEQRLVPLIGDGIGANLKKASLYACNCSGAGQPWSVLPIGFAVVLVVFRRRRPS